MSHVYFLRAGEDGPIKIGITNGNYQIRIAALQPGCPWPIKALGSVPGNFNHENWLHRRFASERLAGEWFSATAELLAVVNDILAPGYSWPTVLTIAVPSNPFTKSLIDHVDEFLAANALTATAFGRIAIGDPNLVRNLRSGRELRFDTARRVHNFMASADHGASS